MRIVRHEEAGERTYKVVALTTMAPGLDLVFYAGYFLVEDEEEVILASVLSANDGPATLTHVRKKHIVELRYL